MIAYIKGKVAYVQLDYVIVEAYGIGYQVHFSRPDKVKLNEEVQMFTYQHIREDENTLYGFLSAAEKDLFIKLISVKGLGPKTAMNMFSAMSMERILDAIETGDVALIKSLPGIGAKTASQIVLDLKGKLVQGSSTPKASVSAEVKDALDALKALGYKGNELSGVEKLFAANPGKTVDEYVKMGLKHMLQSGR